MTTTAAQAASTIERTSTAGTMPRPVARVSLIVPALNEATTVEHVLRRLSELPWELEVLVVDDGSQDDTAAIVERLAGELEGIRLLRHETNRGKGAAVRTGIDASTGDIVAIQD